MYYTFYQNKSGGFFEVDEEKGLSRFVIIEADSIKEANEKAEEIGIYFNGTDDHIDCPCCGDRWCPTYSSNEHRTPLVYGQDVRDPRSDPSIKFCGSYPEGYIHYKDGRIESFWPHVPREVEVE